MKNFEYLSEKESEALSLKDYIAAARRTLEELYERKSYFESNPPGSETLHLSRADRRLLRGFKIKTEDGGTASADSDSPI